MSLLGFSFVACLASCGVPVKFNHQPCLWTIPPSREVEACSRQRTSVCYTYPSRVLFLLQLLLSIKMEIEKLSEPEKAVLSTGQTEANSFSPSLSVGDWQQLPPTDVAWKPSWEVLWPGSSAGPQEKGVWSTPPLRLFILLLPTHLFGNKGLTFCLN